jgi:hypothetical protein
MVARGEYRAVAASGGHLGTRPAPPPGRPPAPSAAAWVLAAHARQPPGSASPGPRGPASGRSRARPTARSRCCLAPAPAHASARPSGAHGAAAPRARAPRGIGAWALQALEGQACTSSACVRPAGARPAGAAGGRSQIVKAGVGTGAATATSSCRRHRCQSIGPASATGRRWRSRRCASGIRCPCRRQSGSGRASPAPANRRPRWRAVRSGISASDVATVAASSSQAGRFETGVGTAIGQRQAGGEALRIGADLAGKRLVVRNGMPGAAPQTRMPACGIRNCCFSSRTSTSGSSARRRSAAARGCSGAAGRRWRRFPGRGGSSP